MVASSEDGSTVEQDAIALKHPSPIYVLDGSLYRDDEASLWKKITISLLGKLLLFNHLWQLLCQKLLVQLNWLSNFICLILLYDSSRNDNPFV